MKRKPCRAGSGMGESSSDRLRPDPPELPPEAATVSSSLQTFPETVCAYVDMSVCC